MSYRHIPAMLNEVVNYLNCRPGNVYVDGTLGGCGHARAICERIFPGGTFIGIDQDIDAISNAETVLKDYSSNIHLFHGNFISLPEFLTQLEIDRVDGILLDLGLSLHQLENSGRGFSFRKDEPLDMRMDIQTSDSAEKIVNKLAKAELQKLFKDYKIDIFNAKGSLEGPNKVRVDGPTSSNILEAANIIIATGSEAADIPPLRIDGMKVIGNRDALSLSELPASLIIVGGGVVGCEFANIFARLGVKVSIVEALDKILPHAEREISRLIRKRFEER